MEQHPTTAPAPAEKPKDVFDFSEDAHRLESAMADQGQQEQVAAATEAAANERAGKAGGVFDFSEQAEPSSDPFNFDDASRQGDILRADQEHADRILQATEAAANERAGKAGGTFDYSQENHAKHVATLTEQAKQLTQ